MNEILYTSALNKYKKWVIENKKEVEDDFRERRTMCEEMQSYSKEKLENLTEDEFFNMIAPIWAMRIWGNKKYYIACIPEKLTILLLPQAYSSHYLCPKKTVTKHSHKT